MEVYKGLEIVDLCLVLQNRLIIGYYMLLG